MSAEGLVYTSVYNTELYSLCVLVLLWTPRCCGPHAGGNGLSGQSEINIHLHTVCQQGGSSPAAICGSSKIGGEQ